MKNFINISRALMFTALAVTLNAQANLDDCFDGNWDVQVKGGVAPIVWAKRGNFSVAQAVVLPNGALQGNFFEFQQVNKFSHYFKLPWTVGFEVGYELNDNIRLYGDFHYRQAKGKTFSQYIPVFAGTALGTLQFNKYQSYSGYMGADYAFMNDCWCQSLGFFVGGKIGVTGYSGLSLSGSFAFTGIPGVAVASSLVAASFSSAVVVSGGGRVGADWAVCENFAVVLTAEFLAQSGRPLNRTIIAAPLTPVSISSFRFGDVLTEVVFPVTLGFMYRF